MLLGSTVVASPTVIKSGCNSNVSVECTRSIAPRHPRFFSMNIYSKATALALAIILGGCSTTSEIRPTSVICPILGATLGVGVVAGGLDLNDSDEDEFLAAGAILGAVAGHFVCKDRSEPPKATPAPAPRPAPKPAPKPAPPKDSDGDGVIDPNDECPGTPPGVAVNSVGCPEVGEKLITLHGVNFDTASAAILPESEGILNEAVKVLNENASVHVRVEGHTDSRGTDAFNRKLSQKRADSVVGYLVSKGINADRLSAVGYGENAPMVPNDSPENMFKNRRVELTVTQN